MNNLRAAKTDSISTCHPIGRNLTGRSENVIWVDFVNVKSSRKERSASQTTAPIGFNGGDTNLYGYVLNDPVNLIDPSGNCPWCIGAAIGGIASGTSAYLAGGDISTIAISATIGAAAGAVSMGASAFATSASGIIATNALIGAGANIATQLATGTSVDNLNYTSVGISAAAGGIGAAAGLGAGTSAFYRTPVLGRPLGLAAARRNELMTSLLIVTTLGTGIEMQGIGVCKEN